MRPCLFLRSLSRGFIRQERTTCRSAFSRGFSSNGGTDDDAGTRTEVEDESIFFPSSIEEQALLVREVSGSPSLETELPINFADISRAAVAIRGGVKRTTCERSHFLSELIGANVYFKNEFRQFTGSFKERGARNAILQLMREQKNSLKGVIAASAGNHALALAYHGMELGVPVTVVMPTVAPMAKVDKCRVCQY